MAGIADLVRPHLRAVRPYVPGKPIDELRRDLGVGPDMRIVKLASNENTAGTSPLARQAILDQLDRLWLYPEDSVFYLKRRLAEDHGVPPEWIVVGNGAVEVIYLLAQALLDPGDKAIMGRPGFMIYPIMAQMYAAEAVQVEHPEHRHDLRAMAAAIDDRTKIVWLDNPNNPAGTYLGRREIEWFLGEVDGRAIVVLDEAYHHFVDHPDACDGMRYVREGVDNVVVLRTFSKIVGLAGLRVGYGVMHPDLARVLGSLRIKFSVNTLAQAAALAALDDHEHVRRAREQVLAGRRYFAEHTRRLGLSMPPTQGNFAWIDFGRDARPICEGLMREGVIVRPGWIFGFPNHARVSISNEDDNRFFFERLERVLARLG